MTTETLMRASGMSDREIDAHRALVDAGFTVREQANGYYLRNVDREILRGPFATREQAWRAAEEIG